MISVKFHLVSQSLSRAESHQEKKKEDIYNRSNYPCLTSIKSIILAQSAFSNTLDIKYIVIYHAKMMNIHVFHCREQNRNHQKMGWYEILME